MLARISRLLGSPRTPPLAALLGLLLSLPALDVGLLHDDLLHRAMIEERLPGFERGPTELYELFGRDRAELDRMREHGYAPWWTDDELSIRFLRPLASALLVLDVRLFGDNTRLAHAHSLGWYVALVLLVAALLRRCLSPRSATLGALVFALAGAHTSPIAWLAARHVLVAATVGLAGLWLHLRAREDGWRAGRVLAPAAIAVALAFGETALGAVAFVCCYELLGARGPRSERLWVAAPYAALALAWLGGYGAAGYGAHRSGVYLDPLHEPGAFLAELPLRLATLVGELAAAVPSLVYQASPAAPALLAAVGLLAAAVVLRLVWLVRPRLDDGERSALPWLGAGALLALMPNTAAIMEGRLTTVAWLGAAAILGAVLAHGWPLATEGGLAWRRRVPLIAALAVLTLAHLGLSPLLRVVLTGWSAEAAAEEWRVAETTQIECDGDVVILACHDPGVAFYAPVAMLLRGRASSYFRVLSMARQDHLIERVTPTGFDLVTPEPRRRSWWEGVHRSRPLRAGDRFDLPGLRATVLAANGNGPRRVRFDFGRPLDAPDLCFLRWHDDRFEPLELPPPGETLLLRR